MEGPFIVAIVAIVFGILYAGYEQWLKHQAQREEAGMPSQELKAALDEMQQQLAESEQRQAELQRRIQNLEAIVTSEAWDELGDGTGHATLSLPEDERIASDTDADRAEKMARRLRT